MSGVSNERLAEMIAAGSSWDFEPVLMAKELLSLRNAQSEAVAWEKPAHPSAAEPFFIFDADRVHDWQKAVFTIPLYTHPAPQSEAVAVTALELPEGEVAVLRYASEPYTSSTATHWFRRHMAKPDATARDAYLHLRKMAASGLMEGVSYGGGKIRWWKITPAGRAALSQQTGSDNE